MAVGPPVVLGPPPWSLRGPSFHTGNRPLGTTVVPSLYLGVGTMPGPSTTATRDQPWSPFLHYDKPALRAATGRKGGTGDRAQGRSRTVTRPPIVGAPLAGSWEGTVAGSQLVHRRAAHRTSAHAAGRTSHVSQGRSAGWSVNNGSSGSPTPRPARPSAAPCERATPPSTRAWTASPSTPPGRQRSARKRPSAPRPRREREPGGRDRRRARSGRAPGVGAQPCPHLLVAIHGAWGSVGMVRS